MHLDVLLEVGGSSEGLTALLADERLLLHVDASMSVEIGLLIELLIALIEVALIWLRASMDQFVSF